MASITAHITLTMQLGGAYFRQTLVWPVYLFVRWLNVEAKSLFRSVPQWTWGEGAKRLRTENINYLITWTVNLNLEIVFPLLHLVGLEVEARLKTLSICHMSKIVCIISLLNTLLHLDGLVAWGHTTLTWLKLLQLRATVAVTGLDHLALSSVKLKCKVKVLFTRCKFRYLSKVMVLCMDLCWDKSLWFCRKSTFSLFGLLWLSPVCFCRPVKKKDFCCSHLSFSTSKTHLCQSEQTNQCGPILSTSLLRGILFPTILKGYTVLLCVWHWWELSNFWTKK